jgi:fructokinase
MPASRRFLCVGLGEVLWDLLPAGKQLGGAPANFAYHAHALGAEALVVSRVGDDALGREILERLRGLGLSTGHIGVDKSAPTGTVSVEVQPDGQPRFIIHENVAWDRLSVSPDALARVAHADAICFGSLAQRGESARHAVRQLVGATPAITLRVFDINLRQQFYSRETIEGSLLLANVLKLNDQELTVLAAMFGLRGDAHSQLAALAQRFHLRAVAFTRGSAGSLLLADGVWSERPGLRVSVVDAVGAGDAFTAAMTLGLLAGWPLKTIHRRANEIAAFVCTQAGATPALPPELKKAFSE